MRVISILRVHRNHQARRNLENVSSVVVKLYPQLRLCRVYSIRLELRDLYLYLLKVDHFKKLLSRVLSDHETRQTWLVSRLLSVHDGPHFKLSSSQAL